MLLTIQFSQSPYVGRIVLDTTLQFEKSISNADDGLSSAVLDDVVGMVWQRDSQANAKGSVDSNTSVERAIGDKSASGKHLDKLEQVNVIDHPSPNYSSRNGQPIQSLILHYTAEPEAQALKHLCDPKAGVSAHYLVGVDGTIWHLVNESNAAWHAGYSYWDGRSSLNSSSVGIEIANMGNEPYPEAQMKAVEALSREIIERNNISPAKVVGHSDIAVTTKNHKSDPGWFFDWKGLASKGIGVWPQPEQIDYDSSRNWSDSQLKQKLIDYGYTSEADLSLLVGAFQRHFQPELSKTPNKVGVADTETRARLAWLLRNKPA